MENRDKRCFSVVALEITEGMRLYHEFKDEDGQRDADVYEVLELEDGGTALCCVNNSSPRSVELAKLRKMKTNWP